MAIKKTIVLIVIFCKCWTISAQQCKGLILSTFQKRQNCYILDSVLTISDPEIYINGIDPKDTILARQIIKFGNKSKDFESYFKQIGISIKPINWASFQNLSVDTVKLSLSERRALIEKDSLINEHAAAIASGKSDSGIAKKLAQRRYVDLSAKMDSKRKLLFAMYPIYFYSKYRLVMYTYFVKNGHSSFFYEICEFPIGKDSAKK